MYVCRLIHSRRDYPEATPLLMLSILPFLALTVHDSVRFVRKYFDATVPLDSNAVNRLPAMHQKRFLPKDFILKSML